MAEREKEQPLTEIINKRREKKKNRLRQETFWLEQDETSKEKQITVQYLNVEFGKEKKEFI